jgi:hypothetical protein
MDRATVFTFTQNRVAVKLVEKWWKVANYAFQLHFRPMQQLMTVLAVPFESVDSAFGAWHLDHNANASSNALR